jgi:hypothetical protein
VFAYLLRGLAIERADQVWALDITYIPMARGWVYLVAVLDWHSRRVLAHRVSITMEADFCVQALREAATRWGAPEIVNTDQGSQFSSAEFVAEVARIGARQSMDGRGCWRDNVFVERLWRSVKYEDEAAGRCRHGCAVDLMGPRAARRRGARAAARTSRPAVRSRCWASRLRGAGARARWWVSGPGRGARPRRRRRPPAARRGARGGAGCPKEDAGRSYWLLAWAGSGGYC